MLCGRGLTDGKSVTDCQGRDYAYNCVYRVNWLQGLAVHLSPGAT